VEGVPIAHVITVVVDNEVIFSHPLLPNTGVLCLVDLVVQRNIVILFFIFFCKLRGAVVVGQRQRQCWRSMCGGHLREGDTNTLEDLQETRTHHTRTMQRNG
jgi:hypothetical protein